jgi:HEAT repeat protein
MRFRLLIAAAILLAAARAPLFAQGPSSSEKPSTPPKAGGKTLKQWVEEIKHPDPARRETAIRTVLYFGKAAAQEAPPSLITILENDRDAACRVYAALTLSGLADNISSDAAVDVVKVLINNASGESQQLIVRLHAVLALGSFGPKATAAIPVLINRIRDPNSWELRQAALSSLASVAVDKKFGPDPRAVDAVARLLTGSEKSSQVRLVAVSALRVMGRPQEAKEYDLAKGALEKATHDSDKTVVIWGLVGLMTLDKEFFTEERLSQLTHYLKGKDVMLKVTAATALGALGKDAASRIPDVTDLLDDADPLVIATAIDVLSGFKKAAAGSVPALRKVIAKKELGEYFRQASAAAIKEITGVEEKLPAAGAGANTGSALTKPSSPNQIGGKTLDQWIKEINNPDPSIQETAMRVVPYFGTKAGPAAPSLVARMKDHSDIACRAHAILALAAIADQVSDKDASEAIKALTYALEDGQVILRFHAATALGAYGTRASSAIPALINRIQDPNSWELRQTAISSLSNVASTDKVGSELMGPDPRAVVAIANRLLSTYENSAQVRMMAVMALGALGRPAGNPQALQTSIHALQNARNDKDKSVEIWAAVALMAVDKVTDKGLDEVAKHISKGKDVAAKLTAARALGAMGKEAKPKIGEIAKLLDEDDPMVLAITLDVLAGLGTNARETLPALTRFSEKIDTNKDMNKEQREYFKEAAKNTIEQIEGARK